MTIIQQKISRLRNRVKAIVVFDTLLAMVICLVIGFSLAFCFDYLPVWLGMTELPLIPRLIMLIGILGVAIYLLATRGIGRLLTKIPDESLKLLIEKTYPEFLDSLLTLSNRDHDRETSARHRFMLEMAERDVAAKMDRVNVNDIVSYGAIKWKLGTLSIFLVGFFAVYMLAPDLISKGFRRTFLLSQESLPRQSLLSNARIRVFNEDEFIARVFPPEFHSLDFNAVTQIAIGSRIEITVDAVAKNGKRQFAIPRSCRLRYQLNDGRRGSIVMNQAKRNRDGSVSFASQKGTLDGFASDGKVWIQGFDCTVGPFEIKWIDKPTIVSFLKTCIYPAYLVENSALWQNGTTPLLNNENLPVGTMIELVAVTNRPSLSKVVCWDHQENQEIELTHEDSMPAEIRIPLLIGEESLDLSIAMVDADGITSPNATRIKINAIVDRPPAFSVTPVGIGAAITENARVPIEITATDEFGIASGHVDLIGDGEIMASLAFPWESEDRQTVIIDLLDLRKTDEINLSNDGSGKSRLIMQTFLSDHNPKSQEVIGQDYEFEIVAEKRFLQLIEREEAGLRKRLEGVRSELDGSRGLLLIHRKAAATMKQKSDLESSPIILQRARLQVQKSSLEINDISNAFGRLIDQLKNNRVEVSKKQGRLVNDVKLPLLALVDERMSRFSSMLQSESNSIKETLKMLTASSKPDNEKGGLGEVDTSSIEAILRAADQLLTEHASIMKRLDDIILRLAKFESYGELLDVVRGLIDEQKGLIDQTQKERDRKAFDSLLD